MITLFTTQQFETAKATERLPLQCQRCKKTFFAEKRAIQTARKGRSRSFKGNFCSRVCSSKSQLTGIEAQCNFCGNKVYRAKADYYKSKTHFCNHSCAMKYKNLVSWPKELPRGWSGSTPSRHYRAKTLRLYGHKCSNSKCPLATKGEMPSFMYEVHHIDGNHSNNANKNLRVLCVWCHRALHFKPHSSALAN